jgi:short-subunit dehydrogenase involved in D-alanine esterification of teichoic acids
VPHLQTNLVTPMTMTGAFIEHTVRFDCPRKVLAISSGAARNPVPGWSPTAPARLAWTCSSAR